VHPSQTTATALSPTRRWTVLAVCASALFLVGLDTTVVTVALPAVGDGLQVDPGQLAWVVDAYTVPFAGLLITSGALADRFGRRRVFCTGLVIFAAASLACALAPTAGMLVTARAVQGVGASMLSPVALAIVVNVITEPRERALAVGVWGSVFGLSTAVGPVAGGLLTDTVGWQGVFWINIPLVAAALALVARFVPESRAGQPRRPDIPGQLLLTLLLVCGVGLLIEGPRLGWSSPVTVTAVLVLVVTVPVFVLTSSRRAEPLLDPGLFRFLPFTGAVVSAVVVFTAFSVMLVLTTVLLQDAYGWSATAAGTAALPAALGAFVGAPVSGLLVGRTGAGTPLLVSGACLAAGGLLLSVAAGDGGVDRVLLSAGCLLTGTGVGLSSSPLTTTAVNSLPADRAGVAGGVTSTARQVGTAVGAAVAGALAAGGPGAWTGTLVTAVCGVVVIVVTLICCRSGNTHCGPR
jgi:EmrB/QacA subfamily drug resistance transporter